MQLWHNFFLSFPQCHGFLGILWESQMFLITLCVHPIKQLAQDVINTTRSRGLINHPFFRKGQCSGSSDILILLNRSLAKNILAHFPICQEKGSVLLSSLDEILLSFPFYLFKGKNPRKLGLTVCTGKFRKFP